MLIVSTSESSSVTSFNGERAVTAKGSHSQGQRGHRRRIVGVVISDRTQKTVVVVVTRRVRSAEFGKYQIRRAKYKAHSSEHNVHVGDTVLLCESRPLSREKRWRVEKLLRKAEHGLPLVQNPQTAIVMNEVEHLLSALSVGSDAYRAAYRLMLDEEGETSVVFDDLDDQLLDRVNTQAGDVERACRINLELLEAAEDPMIRGYTYNTLLASLIQQGRAGDALRVLEEGLEFTRKHDLTLVSKSLCGNILKAFTPSVLPLDECLHVLSIVSNHHLLVGDKSKAIANWRDAVFMFSDLGAFPAALRILERALNLARQHCLVEEEASLLDIWGTVLWDMRAGVEQCVDSFTSARQFRTNHGLAIPHPLTGNLATALMAKGDHAGAAELFREALVAGHTPAQRLQAVMNLAVCQRELGKLADSLASVSTAEALIDGKTPMETPVELHLIGSKCALATGDVRLAVRHLHQACDDLERWTTTVGRPHFRRGIRSKKISRIKHLLFELPESGTASDVLPIFAFLRHTTFVDWARTLDRVDNLEGTGAIAAETVSRVRDAIDNVLVHGVPVMDASAESGDDPFEPGAEPWAPKSSASAWHGLNLALREIDALFGSTKDSRPVCRAFEALLREQNGEIVLLFLYFEGERWFLYSVRDGQYARVPLASPPLFGFISALHAHHGKDCTRDSLLASLDDAVDAVSRDAAPIIVCLRKDPPAQIILFTDGLSDTVPLPAALLLDDAIRSAMSSGRCVLRSCPIAHPQARRRSPDSFLGLWDSTDGLLLAREELVIASRCVPPASSSIVDLSESFLPEVLAKAEHAAILHVASHGRAIANYGNPHSASIAGPSEVHSIRLADIQSEFWRYRYMLAILNVCDGASTTLLVKGRPLVTDELIGYPAVFLLNRSSAVIAPLWPVSDILAFVFSYQLYRHLAGGETPEVAHNRTIAELWEIDRDAVSNILSSIEDLTLRERFKAAVLNGPVYPFRHPYHLGGYLVHTLL